MSKSFVKAMLFNKDKSKLNKDKAFEHIKELMNKFDDGEPIVADDLAPLLSFFMPAVTKSKAAKDDFYGVALASGIKDIRYYLNYVYSDGEVVVATDGYRLHITPYELPEGFYCHKTKTLLHDKNYHNYVKWEQIIPTNYKNRVKFSEIEIIHDEEYTTKVPKVQIHYNGSLITKVSEKYINDAITFLGDDFFIDYGDVFNSLLLTDLNVDSKLAVIMPMR